MLRSSREEMAVWVREINAQFLSQVAITVDRLNGIDFATEANATSECIVELRSVAGSDIQEIVLEVISDLELIQRDYVFLLQDSIDLYISSNQKWPLNLLMSFNMIKEMNVVLNLMETFVFDFYREMFEVQIEEILIEMRYFKDLVNETQSRAFTALSNVSDQFKRNFINC